MDAVQDHQDASGTSGTSTSVLDPDRNVSGKVRQSGSSTPVDQINSGGSGDHVLKRFSPPVTVPATPTQTKTSRSTRSLSPPVKKMPIPHFARPAPDRDHPVREKKPRHQEPARSSGSAGSSGDTSMTIRGSFMDKSGCLTSASIRDFQGSTTSSTVHRESQVLVPSSGAEQITAINISGLAGGAQSKSWDEPLRYPLVAESKVRGNFQQLLQICRACNTPPLWSSKLGISPVFLQVQTSRSDSSFPELQCWRVPCLYTGLSTWINRGLASTLS